MGSNERKVDPPMPVLVLDDTDHWQPGKLRKWSREPDAWYGWVMRTSGMTNWYRADRIKPA